MNLVKTYEQRIKGIYETSQSQRYSFGRARTVLIIVACRDLKFSRRMTNHIKASAVFIAERYLVSYMRMSVGKIHGFKLVELERVLPRSPAQIQEVTTEQ